jgi:hypothetical protein
MIELCSCGNNIRIGGCNIICSSSRHSDDSNNECGKGLTSVKTCDKRWFVKTSRAIQMLIIHI